MNTQTAEIVPLLDIQDIHATAKEYLEWYMQSPERADEWITKKRSEFNGLQLKILNKEVLRQFTHYKFSI